MVQVRPPGSKSLTNRALLLAALARGTSTLTGALVEAQDAQVMIRALEQLGAGIEILPEVGPSQQPTASATLRVHGVGGRWKLAPGQSTTLDLANAGTATRFLTAAAALQPAPSTPDVAPTSVVIDGNTRMRERPIGELVQALQSLGLRVSHTLREGFPPVRVLAPESSTTKSPTGAEVSFGQTTSSQFISALLLIAPLLEHGLTVHFTQVPTSPAYVRMTLALLARLGHTATGPGADSLVGHMHLAPKPVEAFELAIEPDASGATYFIAAEALLAGSSVIIEGLDASSSLQGDAHFAQAAAALAKGPADLDMSDMPDAAMTAAVMACFASGPSTLRGLRTLRVKETDRIDALVTELAKVSVRVEPFAHTGPDGRPDEGVVVTPPARSDDSVGIDCTASARPVEFETYDDHRMAMSLALIGLRRPGVTINDPACVRKTYPTFWQDLARLYQRTT
jgi:3-phosphoshikimate 1-carboxyvinyltransferase